MYALMIYSLKTGVCLAAFYLFFKLLMSRETFHRLNRMLVLGAVVLSFVLPLCVITVYRELPAVPHSVVPPNAAGDSAAEAAFDWETLLGVLFFAGVVVTLTQTLCSLFSVFRIIRSGRREQLAQGVRVVYVPRPIVPFSWGNYVVISQEGSESDRREIITHELTHVRLHHSLDLLVMDLARCVQWFNPAIWLLRRELRAIHEYEADRAVLQSGADARQYQLLLIRKAAAESWCAVVNNLNHSKLKNRIAMMLCKKSSRWAGAKALLVIPLVGIALGAFAQTTYVAPKPQTERVSISTTGQIVSIKGVAGEYLIIANGQIVDELPAATDGHRTMKFVRDSSMLDAYGQKARNGVLFVEDSIVQEGSGADSVASTSRPVVIVSSDQTTQTTVESKLDGSGLQVRTSHSIESPTPLIIINGVEQPYEQLNALKPEQIESISVLKDKTAIAKYGEKARDGVIEVIMRK